MGERANNRAAVDRLTRRIVEHGRVSGKPISTDEARMRAASTARMADRRQELSPIVPRPGRRVLPSGFQTVRGVYRIDPRQARELKREG